MGFEPNEQCTYRPAVFIYVILMFPFQISEAIKLFGVSSNTKDLILVHVAMSHIPDIQQRMSAIAEGELVPLSTIPESTSWVDIKRASAVAYPSSPLSHIVSSITSSMVN